MRVALICYHKNAKLIYPEKWVEEFRHSILNQTYKGVGIVEMNYGDDDFLIFGDKATETHLYPHPTFAHAMNYLLDRCFVELRYDCVGNLNCDDTYSLDKNEKQIEWIEKGFDIVSSNFSLVKNDEIILTHQFDKLDIQHELEKFHNPLCHPVIMYSRKFWEGNRYRPDEIPFEDMLLWKRAISNGYKFKILPDVLCYHRLHEKSVGHNLKEAQ